MEPIVDTNASLVSSFVYVFALLFVLSDQQRLKLAKSQRSMASDYQAETTFKNYDSQDAAKYAAYRPSYNPKLIDLIVNKHTSTGGQLNTLLDVGCGPALATRQLSPVFQHVFGTDASASMIDAARQTPCPTATGEQPKFSVCTAEDIDTLFEAQSIDLITVATAAHWFDLPRFYAAASKVLKPNGSIAMWCGGGWYPDPNTTPNAEHIMKVWTELEAEILSPFEKPGNRMARELYDGLPLPWTVDPSAVPADTAEAMNQFDQERSMMRQFNKDGKPENDELLKENKGYMKYARFELEQAKLMFGTASPVTRWRQAHREKLEKGEIEDCVDYMIRRTREELDQTPEGKGRTWIEAGVAFVLIVIKMKPS